MTKVFATLALLVALAAPAVAQYDFYTNTCAAGPYKAIVGYGLEGSPVIHETTFETGDCSMLTDGTYFNLYMLFSRLKQGGFVRYFSLGFAPCDWKGEYIDPYLCNPSFPPKTPTVRR